jgi:hypothetical protein
MATHDFHDESAVVAGGSARKGIDGFGDAMQGSVSSNSHIGAKHVVVDRTDQSHQEQVGVSLSQLLADLILINQFG